MSKETYARMLGVFVMLSLALAGLMFIPAGASAEGMANLKVLVKNQKEENIDSADVFAVNVHSGMEYDLSWSDSEGWFEAEVPPGTYQVFASSKGYISPQEAQMVYGITEDNDGVPQIIIKLTRIDNQADVRIQVTDGIDEVESAEVHLFGEGGAHLKEMTTNKGWANFTAPNGPTHVLIFKAGMLVISDNFTVNNTETKYYDLENEPSGDEGSYRIMGLVKSGKTFVPGLNVHIWDGVFSHMVPVKETEDGALSIPLYPSVFHLLVEAEGYEPLWVPSIDLTTGENYYRPVNNTFEMTAVETMESKVTTIDLTGNDGIINPMITTVWTLDANSRFYGTPNSFGNPRMQASGVFYSAGWLELTEQEAQDVETELEEFGPAWISTGDFFMVNGEHYEADLEAYDVMLEGLFGADLTETGINPVATMSTDYTTKLSLEKDEDLRLEVFSIFEGETVEIVLPDDYEILGEFGEKAEFPDGNTSRLMVYEPLEFNAKKEERPVADLDFIISRDSYKVEDNKYIVKLYENVTLSADGSYDPVGEIVEYHWSNIPSTARIWVDDENLSYEQSLTTELDEVVIQFTKNSDEYVNVTLQVLDSSGKMSEETDYLLIMPDSEAPVFNNYTVSIQVDEEDDEWELLSEPYSIEEDILVEFNVSASDNGEIVDYIWTFSDDSGSVNGQIITHRFADPGVYNISLEIVDSVGNKREVANSTISVSDETDPMSVIKPFDANGYTINEEFVLNATQSYDPRTDEDITEGLTFEWYVYEEGDDWVNQTLIGEEMVMNHSISEPGVYRINLTVTDSANNTGWSEKTLVINGIDLVVENLEFVSPDENDLKKGEKIKMSILIRNVGEVDAEDPIDIVLYRNTKVVKKTTLDDGLNAGKSHYWNFSFTPDYSGEYEWKVMIDPDNAIDEDTKDNNELSRPATIKETDSQLRDYWYVIPIIIVILIIVYVVYMKYTRGLWGYEPIVEWWNKRNN
jgi:hypothetical protein